ncbi:MAG: (2Fe-2S)-binding protein [Pseudomonadota bacterium]
MGEINLTLNGQTVTRDVEDRTLLVSLLRDDLGLTGTHIGCDTSQCGACVVHVDGQPVKACAVLAVQVAGTAVTTIEGLADGDRLHPMQAAFQVHQGLQCGFCTPGMIMMGVAIANRHGGAVSDATIRHELEGNICRCTGYHAIVAAIGDAARQMSQSAPIVAQ